MRSIIVKTLINIIKNNKKTILVTADLGFDTFDIILKKYPKQFINVGIAEQNMIGIASGLAIEGYTIFTYSITNFTTFRCLEQIRNDACYHNLNIKIIGYGGGFTYEKLGFSHHGSEDLSIMRPIPNLKILSPGTKWEAFMSIKESFKEKGVFYIRIDKESLPVDNFPKKFKIGKSRKIILGNDITIISTGGMLNEVIKSSKKLINMNIKPTIISMHTIKPIDKKEIIKSIKNTKGIITVEENNIIGGLGSAVAEVCIENKIKPQIFKRIGIEDSFSYKSGSHEHLKKKFKMNFDYITKTIINLLKK